MTTFDFITTISEHITNAQFSQPLAQNGKYRLILRPGANNWVYLQLWNGGPVMFLPVAYQVGREWRLDFTASSCKLAELVGLLNRFGLEVG